MDSKKNRTGSPNSISGSTAAFAMRPELAPSDIYGSAEIPNVVRFNSEDEAADWLDAALPNQADITFKPLTRREVRRYVRVAIRNLAELEGPPWMGLSFDDFVAQRGLDPWPEFKVHDQLNNIFSGRDPCIGWTLGMDWKFAAIHRHAQLLPGHAFGGSKLKSFSYQLVAVVADLLLALRVQHPCLPAIAVAEFLQSWEVFRAIAEFCRELANSREAQVLAQERRIFINQLVEEARLAVGILISAYAHWIRAVSARGDEPAAQEAMGAAATDPFETQGQRQDAVTRATTEIGGPKNIAAQVQRGLP